MQTTEIFIILLLLATVGILVYVFFIRKEAKKDESEGMLLLQRQLHDLTRTMDERMGENNRAAQEGARMQFRESRELIQEINKEVNEQLRNVVRGVTEVSESSKQVFTIADQLQNLEKIITHQKQRGNLGEASLQLALENMLPPSTFKLQYQFDGGDTVDAIIMTKDGMIPVDAKFSLDNYRRLIDETDAGRREELEKEFKGIVVKPILNT